MHARLLALIRSTYTAAFERRFKIHLVSVTHSGLRQGLFFTRLPLDQGNSNYGPLFPYWKYIPVGSQYPRLTSTLWVRIEVAFLPFLCGAIMAGVSLTYR